MRIEQKEGSALYRSYLETSTEIAFLTIVNQQFPILEEVTTSDYSTLTYGQKLILAAKNGDTKTADEMLRWCIKREDARQAFITAAKHNQAYIMKQIYRKEWAAIRKEDTNLAFLYAADRGHDEAVEMILSNVFCKPALQKEIVGRAFYRATANGHVQIIRRIMKEHTLFPWFDAKYMKLAGKIAKANSDSEMIKVFRSSPHMAYYLI